MKEWPKINDQYTIHNSLFRKNRYETHSNSKIIFAIPIKVADKSEVLNKIMKRAIIYWVSSVCQAMFKEL